MSEASGLTAEEAHLSFGRYVRLVRDVLDVPTAIVMIPQEDARAAKPPEAWPAERAAALLHEVRRQVIEDASAVTVVDARKDERTAHLALAPGPVACLGVPLKSADEVVGVLCALDDEPREWTDRDLHLLTGLSAACSAELTLRDSRAEQQRSQRSARHSRLLLALSETLTATSTVESVVQVVQEVAVEYLDAQSAQFEVTVRHEHDPDRTLAIALSGALPGRLTVTWASEEAARPWLRASTGAERPPGQVQAQLEETVAALAHYASTALDRAILLQERRSAAATLQHAMLTTLPELSYAQLAARYVPAAAANQVGGDWYDAVAVPALEGVAGGNGFDGLAVVIGDVAGHDIAAAATMGQVRSILRGLLVDRPQPPAQMITRLDSALTRLGVATTSSLVLAMLHGQLDRPGVRNLSWASAGHPPPVHINARGQAALLGEAPDLLLGIPLGLPRNTRQAELHPGDTLILYTDGLIQRPGQSLAAGQRRLMDSAAQHHARPLTEVLDGILGDLVKDAPEDDCAVLAVRLS